MEIKRPSIEWNVAKCIVKLLVELSGDSKDDVVANLFDEFQPLIVRVIDPEFSNSWTTKKFQYKGTPLMLKLKAKSNCGMYQKKVSSINLSADLWKDRPEKLSGDDLDILITEKILLKAPV